MLEIFFLLSKLFYKEKVHEFQQIYGKMWMKKCLMEEIKYIILSSSGSGLRFRFRLLTSYGSGSTSQSYGSYGSGSTTLLS
jgi:hypothetical protein